MNYTKVNKLSKECKDNIMNSIKQEKMLKAPIPWKWKTASIAALLALVLLIPINGKTALATVRNWVENISIQGNTVSLKVVSYNDIQDLNLDLDQSTLVSFNHKDFNVKLTDNRIPILINDINELKRLETDKNQIMASDYVFRDLSFSHGEYYFEDINTPVYFLYYNNIQNPINSILCEIAYHDDIDEFNSTTYLHTGIKKDIKDVSLTGAKGHMLISREANETNDVAYDLKLIQEKHHITISLHLLHNLSDTTSDAELQSELTKMAQSLLDKIDSSLK